MRSPAERLWDILDALAQIGRYAVRGRGVFEQDELIQVWMVHHLQIIGEAATQLGQDFHSAHPELPWPEIVSMRNVLVHEYFGIDLDTIWRTIEHDLPLFEQSIRNLLTKLEREG